MGVNDVVLSVGNGGLGVCSTVANGWYGPACIRSILTSGWNDPACACDITASTRTVSAFVDHKFCLELNG